MKIRNIGFLVVAATLIAATYAFGASISGAGATFPYPVYAKWAEVYKKETGTSVNYQSIGSGGGIQQIRQKTVTFGASDMPLQAADLARDGLIQFPTVMGGVVPIVNLDGIGAGDLVLDGPTLARIYLGEITKWNDPAIKRLNPNLRLPASAILVAHRSDGSGTTFLFSDYLSKVSPAWKSNVGANTSVAWPVGLGARGNEGVAATVAGTKGAIGYVEYTYVKQVHLVFAKMINKDGRTVAPTAAAFQAAAAHADWLGTPGFRVILTDQSGADTWPISGATFILMHTHPQNDAESAEALQFFAWAYEHGGALAEQLDYVPMPASVVDAVKKVWRNEIKDAAGRSIFKG